MNLPKETQRATKMLKGKTVDSVKNFRKKEVLIEFTDGTRLFVDWQESELEISIEGNFEEEN
ncbi:MAG TPA: hypothetical protein VNI60_06420 [Pyrinomonadaceae bacterium]|jgi:hypothetical protein|nr:hypothetical protein [Pyrinomonadaceae bacterium]